MALRSARASPEVWRALDFVMHYLLRAFDAFSADEERCRRDVILVLVGRDDSARCLYEQLIAAAPPAGYPPTIAKDSVQVMAVPLAVLVHFVGEAYDVEDLDFPHEPDTVRLAVFVDGTMHLSRRRLRYKDASAYTPEQLRDHTNWMVRAARKEIREMVRKIPRGGEGRVVVALFHGADEKAMRLYPRVVPLPYPVPANATTVKMVLVEDLLREAPNEGYELDAAELAPLPGFVRIPVFTLGRMFVETMSKVTMEPGGDA